MVSAAEELRVESEVVINSRVLPGNLLPNFMQSQGRVESGTAIKLGAGRGVAATTIPDDSCADDIWENLNMDLRSPQLPNLSQDIWTCSRTEETQEVFVYENEFTRVAITPQYGGRVNSIVDKEFVQECCAPASQYWRAQGVDERRTRVELEPGRDWPQRLHRVDGVKAAVTAWWLPTQRETSKAPASSWYDTTQINTDYSYLVGSTSTFLNGVTSC